MPKRMISGMGWKPDLPDHRDLKFSVPIQVMNQGLPDKVDLRSDIMPPVYSQGRIGSCSANAIAAAIQFDRRKFRLEPDFIPSRLFIYYNEREIEGHVATDSGAYIRDGIKSANKQGVCPAELWPYDDTPAPDHDTHLFPEGSPPRTKPTDECYGVALEHQVVRYESILQDVEHLKGCLASGYPFVFGFYIYSNWYHNPTLVVPMPDKNNEEFIGGHAVMAVGYDDDREVFIIRNSWGANFQEDGYFYLPYAYLTDASLSSDFWVIYTMEA